MNERHLEPEEAAARALVHELGPLAGEPRELGADVGDLEGDVVQAGAALGEEPADRRVGGEGREQLHSASADVQRCRLDALVFERLAVLELGPEEPAVGVDGRVEILDRDPDMVDARQRYASALTARTTPTESAARDSGSTSPKIPES